MHSAAVHLWWTFIMGKGMSTRFLHCKVAIFLLLTNEYVWGDTLSLQIACCSSNLSPLGSGSVRGRAAATAAMLLDGDLCSLLLYQVN